MNSKRLRLWSISGNFSPVSCLILSDNNVWYCCRAWVSVSIFCNFMMPEALQPYYLNVMQGEPISTEKKVDTVQIQENSYPSKKRCIKIYVTLYFTTDASQWRQREVASHPNINGRNVNNSLISNQGWGKLFEMHAAACSCSCMQLWGKCMQL